MSERASECGERAPLLSLFISPFLPLHMPPAGPASALRSLLRAARPLPPPLRRKLAANVRDLAGLQLGLSPADAACAARLVAWVAALPEVRGRGGHAARGRVSCWWSTRTASPLRLWPRGGL